ncbi:5-oxoprolinase subunit PxpA [Robiginitalea sp.]|nr:5-oxoprolinase subunit PxpA [Robiginitalea sp.]
MGELNIQIDINCDVGEGLGNEAKLMPLIHSCNIACGGHAGSVETMREVIRLAIDYEVKIGAHPAYPDKENFGRKTLSMSAANLTATIVSQLHSIEQVLAEVGGQLHHIKAHGALYNDIAVQSDLAKIYLNSLKGYRDRVVLFAPCGSTFVTQARDAGFTIWEEAFADRRYLSTGVLAPRNTEGAVISDPSLVWQQLQSLIKDKRVKSSEGAWIYMQPKTYCIHGDTAGAHEILLYIAQMFEKEFK